MQSKIELLQEWARLLISARRYGDAWAVCQIIDEVRKRG